MMIQSESDEEKILREEIDRLRKKIDSYANDIVALHEVRDEIKEKLIKKLPVSLEQLECVNKTLAYLKENLVAANEELSFQTTALYYMKF
jgi:uncharacterized coiled-coil DUF342 family protein